VFDAAEVTRPHSFRALKTRLQATSFLRMVSTILQARSSDTPAPPPERPPDKGMLDVQVLHPLPPAYMHTPTHITFSDSES
jgi:hypothetical protein